MVALGLRNNNPLNIRASRDVFDGEVTESVGSFKQFSSSKYGYRAAFVLLGTYLKTGRNTLEKILRSWAPPIENQTSAYIASVEKLSGVARNKTLTAQSGNDYIKIVTAMSRIENGKDAVAADVEAGFKLQNKITR
jgi:hypothetical protein